MPTLVNLSLTTQLEQLRQQRISVRELLGAYEAAVETHHSLNAYLHVCIERAREQARIADQRYQEGVARPLEGLLVAVKDNICVEGEPLTCGSRILGNYVSPYDAGVIQKLRNAGAIILGKTNLDEFAMGSSTENSAFGPSLNPWDPKRVPGGSSGGSAVAVSAGLCSAALGSDTGGSIRLPAAWTGIVGIKPTWGRVSRYGLTAFASSLDQIGCLTRTVADSALLLQTIAGFDPHDATSSRWDVPDYLAGIDQDIRGLRVGLPVEFAHTTLQPDIQNVMANCMAKLESLGADLVEVHLPHLAYGIADYYIIATAEASSNLARFDGVRYGFRASAKTLQELYTKSRTEGFGAEVRRRILLGTFVLSAGYYDAYYGRAIRVREKIRLDFEHAFQSCDVILSPTSATAAFGFGERIDPLQMYLTDIFTVGANLAGVPAISIPAGYVEPRLPVGVQFLGPHFEESRLFRVARSCEQEFQPAPAYREVGSDIGAELTPAFSLGKSRGSMG